MTVKLTVADLYKVCRPDVFRFNTTADINELGDLIGQERALKAIDFGLDFSTY